MERIPMPGKKLRFWIGNNRIRQAGRSLWATDFSSLREGGESAFSRQTSACMTYARTLGTGIERERRDS